MQRLLATSYVDRIKFTCFRTVARPVSRVYEAAAPPCSRRLLVSPLKEEGYEMDPIRPFLFASALAFSAPVAANQAPGSTAPLRAIPADELNCVESELSPAARELVNATFFSHRIDDLDVVSLAMAPTIENCSARYLWGEEHRRASWSHARHGVYLEMLIRRLHDAGVGADRLHAAHMSLSDEDRFALTDKGSQKMDQAEIEALRARIDAKLTASNFTAAQLSELRTYLIVYARKSELAQNWHLLSQQGNE